MIKVSPGADLAGGHDADRDSTAMSQLGATPLHGERSKRLSNLQSPRGGEVDRIPRLVAEAPDRPLTGR